MLVGVLIAYGVLSSFVEGDLPESTPLGKYLSRMKALDPEGMKNAALDIAGRIASVSGANLVAWWRFDEFLRGEVTRVKSQVEAEKK